MKRVIIFTLALIVFAVPAFAEDPFLVDFNIYAENVYGIPQICFQKTTTDGFDYYSSDSFLIYRKDSSIAVFGNNHLDVISAACCTLRWMDNPGSRIDHYGKVMHTYFLARSQNTGKAYSSVTETGIEITVQFSNETLFVWLVR